MIKLKKASNVWPLYWDKMTSSVRPPTPKPSLCAFLDFLSFLWKLPRLKRPFMVIALSIFFGSKPLTIFHLYICRWLAMEISFTSFIWNFWAIKTTRANTGSRFLGRVYQGYRSLISECLSEVYANTWESWATRNWHSTPSLVRLIKQFL